ncbi:MULTISPECIES: AraC family transcriptional regulator [Bacteroides]|uniref:helix-turn-helix domain-containing protein n=1 Tax=Bacteroides TaxID=816 RepID=UPI001F35358B|nr:MULTISPECIES: helix-turn-helix domain-containing protein [Bacteroides]MCF2737707.1 AraC family transcriptional regulator [Bacteroides caecigallinarum]MCR8893054.1 helix-turn-helix domain-containing protein [Bacteroides sp. ET336]MDN0057551.1 helix-turn-helix domain-containing protein [Bacteroides caecigallinarum]
MTHLEKLDYIPQNIDLMAGMDITGNIKHLFKTPSKVPGYMFLLCFQGTCSITVHLTQYTMKKGTLLILLPDLYFQILEQSDDCKFIFTGFATELVRSSSLFSKSIEYTPFIFEKPVLQLDKKAFDLMYSYLRIIIKAKNISNNIVTQEQAALTFTQLILGLGNLIKNGKSVNQQYNRNQEIVKELVRTVVMNYHTERNVSFYADKMHLSPQHLSTTIKKITGKTLTDIISSFIINDAKAKLKSTEMTIQEIAYSLNFPDISFFGKYFKRYTGMSPKQYRNTEL